jgi:hypothetical protein
MNAGDVLKYGHLTVLKTIDGLRESDWNLPGACGVWSIQDILAHLASYEYVLAEVFASLLDGSPTPHLELFASPDYNDSQVALRKGKTHAEVLNEYQALHADTLRLVARIPPETLRQPGTIPWYGAEYALDDLIVYQYYGHKREHCGQIAVFRDTLI